MIHLNGIVILHSDAEIVRPSLKIGADFPIPVVHGDAPTTASKAAQFGLKPCNGFLRDSKPLSGEGEAKERTFLGSHHLAFVPVDLHLEFPFKEPADTFHHALSGTLRLHEDDQVIGIPCEPMPPFLQLLIEVIQKDIAQNGRNGPPCGTPLDVWFSLPFTTTPARRYFPIRRRMPLSLTLRETRFIRTS